jgi:two-component system, OmpR family, sensor kinase
VTLTIRARLTIWYSLVTLLTLVAAALVLSAVHRRLGLNRIDLGLDDNLVTVRIGIDHELDEGLDLRHAVSDALSELELPGTGVAILDAQGALVGARSSGVVTLPESTLRLASAAAQSVPVDGGAVRIRATDHERDASRLRVVVWSSLSPFDAERATVKRTLWVAMPVGLLLAAVGGWVIGWRLLAPLAGMARQANAIDDRRLDGRLVVPATGDELGVLGTAFNSLLDRLAVAFQAQRRFMADASHELRTPLSIARTAAQVTLAQDERTVAEYRESLATVARQTERLTRMVDDMFELALADLDARPLQLEEVYLDEIVNECVSSARVLANDRAVSVAARTPVDVQMQADQSLIRQMILNLVENAVRHTPAGGSVQVAIEADADRAQIAVSDTGPGIPETERERIFERFVRLEANASHGGGGLGLPIARWVAQLHRGTLALESTGPAGSRFVAVLPLR